MKQQPEIILLAGAAGACLAAAEPPFRGKMLEERNEPVSPIMIAGRRRKCAGDRLFPPFVIDEAALPADLAQRTRGASLEGNGGTAVGDELLRSIFALLSAMAGDGINKDLSYRTYLRNEKGKLIKSRAPFCSSYHESS